MAHSFQRQLAALALESATAPPSLDAGMWYAQELIEAAARGARLLTVAEGAPGATPGDHFERLPVYGLYALRVRAQRPAHAALRSFLRGPSVTDCGHWAQAHAYAAVLQAVGPRAFDEAFGSRRRPMPEAQRLTLSVDGPTPLADYVASWNSRDGLPPVQVGDMAYVAGVPGYSIKHACGVSQGWHVVCCAVEGQTPLYTGLGLSEPCTQEALLLRLVDDYNAARRWTDRLLSVLRPGRHALWPQGQAAQVPRRASSALGMQSVTRLQRVHSHDALASSAQIQ